jgi:single-strand DNA-binding protein
VLNYREELEVSDNQVTLVGNLTDDPELRYTPNGVAVAHFRLAVDQRVWDAGGWKEGEPSFFRINVWRDQAEHASKSLRKGARCVVVGRLKSRSWETPEGQRRSLVEIEADEVAASIRFAPVALDWQGEEAALASSDDVPQDGRRSTPSPDFDEVPF